MDPSSPESEHRGVKRALLFALPLVSGALLVGTLTLYKAGVANTYRVRAITPVTVANLTGPAVAPRGERLLTLLVGCTDCHGDALSGLSLEQGERGAFISSPSLVKVGDAASSETGRSRLTRALHIGRDADGRMLWLMPQDATSGLCDADVAAIAQALDARPRAEAKTPQSHLTWGGYVRAALRQRIVVGRHTDLPVPACPQPQDAAAPGAYLFRIAGCASCHQLGTQKAFGEAQTSAFATRENFDRALRDNVAPSGRTCHPHKLAQRLARFSDGEVESLRAAVLAAQASHLGAVKN